MYLETGRHSSLSVNPNLPESGRTATTLNYTNVSAQVECLRPYGLTLCLASPGLPNLRDPDFKALDFYVGNLTKQLG